MDADDSTADVFSELNYPDVFLIVPESSQDGALFEVCIGDWYKPGSSEELENKLREVIKLSIESDILINALNGLGLPPELLDFDNLVVESGGGEYDVRVPRKK